MLQKNFHSDIQFRWKNLFYKQNLKNYSQKIDSNQNLYVKIIIIFDKCTVKLELFCKRLDFALLISMELRWNFLYQIDVCFAGHWHMMSSNALQSHYGSCFIHSTYWIPWNASLKTRENQWSWPMLFSLYFQYCSLSMTLSIIKRFMLYLLQFGSWVIWQKPSFLNFM